MSAITRLARQLADATRRIGALERSRSLSRSALVDSTIPVIETDPETGEETKVGEIGKPLLQDVQVAQELTAALDEAVTVAAADAAQALADAAGAQATAESAQSAAAQAATDAATAQSSAASAQAAADDAAADLLALSGRTGRVIRAASGPTAAEDRNSNNLWLNTSTGQLHEWDGTDWAVITDSRLTAAANAADQAANAAAAAQEQADSAASLAAAAKAQADTATSAASAAQAAATAAQSTADSAASAASAAASAAAAAQGDADAAAQAAADAAGIANHALRALPNMVVKPPAASGGWLVDGDGYNYRTTNAGGFLSYPEVEVRAGQVIRLTVQWDKPNGGDGRFLTGLIPKISGAWGAPGNGWTPTADRWAPLGWGYSALGPVRARDYIIPEGVTAVRVAAFVDTMTSGSLIRITSVSIQDVTETARTDAAVAAKADVLIQDSAPAKSMRKATTLWIDTTNGANTPKRWDGSAWVEVTDKAAKDAAAAAVAAQNTANQAVTDAANAKDAADSAAAAALAAQSTADTANAKASTADGRITIGTANPTTADASGKPINALWEVRAGSTALRRFVLTSLSPVTWTQVALGQDFIGENAIGSAQIADLAVGTAQIADLAVTNAKIGDLSVGKLTATGSAEFPLAVVERLVGQDAFLTNLLARRVVVGDGTNLWRDVDYVLSYSPWLKSGRALSKAGTGAQHGAYFDHSDIEVMPGEKLVAGYTDIRASGAGEASLYLQRRVASTGAWVGWAKPAWSTGAGASLGTAVTVPADTDMVRVGLYTQSNMPTTTTAVVTNIWVRKQVGAVVIEDGAVTADHIRGKSLEGIDIYSPSATALPRVHVGQSVVEVIRSDGEGGSYAATQLGGATDDRLAMFGADGVSRVEISGDGAANFGGEVGVESLRVAGTAMARLLGDAPQASLGHWWLTGNALPSAGIGNTPYGICEWRFPSPAGRRRRLTASLELTGTAGDVVEVGIRYGAGSVSINSQLLRRMDFQIGGLGSAHAELSHLFATGTTVTDARLLLTLRNRSSGTRSITLDTTYASHVDLCDEGFVRNGTPLDPQPSAQVIMTAGGGVPFSGSAPTPTPQPTPQRVEHPVSSWKNFYVSNSSDTLLEHGRLNGGTLRVAQLLFPAVPAGATNVRAFVKLTNAYTYFGAGMTAYVGGSTHSTLQGSAASSVTGNTAVGFTRNQTREIEIVGWTAAHRSVWVGVGAPTGNQYFGRFLPDARIVYTYDL